MGMCGLINNTMPPLFVDTKKLFVPEAGAVEVDRPFIQNPLTSSQTLTMPRGVKSSTTRLESKPQTFQRSNTFGSVLGGVGAAGLAAASMFMPQNKELTYVRQQDTPSRIPDNKIADVLTQLESSGGTDMASADPGEMKWLTGLTDIAIKELKRLNRLPKNFHKNNKQSVLQASTEYFKLMRERHPEKSDPEIYADLYWTQAGSSSERQNKINKVKTLY